jgi:predicted nicotinamide N-methyase
MSRSSAELRAFVRRHTRPADVAGAPGIRIHQGEDVVALAGAIERELGVTDGDLPYWAFAWVGGLGVAAHLLAHPDEVAGRRVLDLAAGSGLCGIVAARLGAAGVRAVDIDPLAEAAIGLNAAANGVHVTVTRRDVLDDPPPDVEVVLAGDVCYSETMAARMTGWLRACAGAGIRVLLGDPGRAYLPTEGLVRLGDYAVPASRELEPAGERRCAVYTMPGRPGPA